MAAGYDNAAWFYDALSRVVFGNALIKSQSIFLTEVPAGSCVLIAGGGTGKILERLSTIHPSGLSIVFCELSPKMMHRANKRNTGGNNVDFQLMPVQNLKAGPFDVIITPFLLDSISADQFLAVFKHLDGLLKPGGLWLNTDFQLSGKWWQRPLLKTMYLFFQFTGSVQQSELPPIDNGFVAGGYQRVSKKLFYGDFIASQVWLKQA